MSCISLHKGQTSTCRSWPKKYFQQAVLVNKVDVASFNVMSDANNGAFRHRIQFSLKDGKTGYHFSGMQNGASYFGAFSKEIDENIPQYTHELQLPIFGASEESKYILKTLDYGNYFAAIQLTDGTVEVYGFENGLTTDDYTFDLQGNLGGSIVPLVSRDMEDEPPFVYFSNSPGEDFDNLFSGVEMVEIADFNNDFNNDFYIVE